MNKAAKIEWKRVGNGEFHSFVDGVRTDWDVINGHMGLTGRDTPNAYVPWNRKTNCTPVKAGYIIKLADAKKLAAAQIYKGMAQ